MSSSLFPTVHPALSHVALVDVHDQRPAQRRIGSKGNGVLQCLEPVRVCSNIEAGIRGFCTPSARRTKPRSVHPSRRYRRVADAVAVQLHNSLIISLFDFTVHRRPPTPPPDAPKQPPRKRRRILPYQGPDDVAGTLRSNRLKRWTVSLGRRERDRVRNLSLQSSALERPRPRKDMDEIARDRGVVLLPERGGEFEATFIYPIPINSLHCRSPRLSPATSSRFYIQGSNFATYIRQDQSYICSAQFRRAVSHCGITNDACV